MKEFHCTWLITIEWLSLSMVSRNAAWPAQSLSTSVTIIVTPVPAFFYISLTTSHDESTRGLLTRLDISLAHPKIPYSCCLPYLFRGPGLKHLSCWPTEWLQHLYLGKPASAVAYFYIYLGLRSRCYKTVDVNWRTSRELWRVSKPFFSILSLTLSGSPPLPRSHLTSVSPPLSFISFLLSHSLALPFSSWTSLATALLNI